MRELAVHVHRSLRLETGCVTETLAAHPRSGVALGLVGQTDGEVSSVLASDEVQRVLGPYLARVARFDQHKANAFPVDGKRSLGSSRARSSCTT
ncbi:hypothetical protein BH11MYX4_BH11MYX4_22250 [soil metagenome]